MKPLEQMALLYDFYAPLLTPRQQDLLRAYYLDDLSLGEIAGEEHVSRQAIHDQIKRAEQSLQEFEVRLSLVAEYQRRQAALADLQAHLAVAAAALPPGSPGRQHLEAALALAGQLVQTDEAAPLGGQRPST